MSRIHNIKFEKLGVLKIILSAIVMGFFAALLKNFNIITVVNIVCCIVIYFGMILLLKIDINELIPKQ